MTSREKNQSSKEIAKMKIESQQMQTDKEIGARLLLSREEAIKALMDSANSNIIETKAEVIE
jgi:DNA-directed RNA polymerase specialized sigma subunit